MDVNIDMISQTAPIDDHVNISFTAPKNSKNLINKLINDLKLPMRETKIDIQKDAERYHKLYCFGIL